MSNESHNTLSQMMPVRVQNLTKRFGNFVAVNNVSFTVQTGEVFGWLGPNGAGKTTTIRMLLGLIKPSSGEAYVLGFNCATQSKSIHAHVGYMSQQFTLYNDLTARQNIRFYGEVQNLSVKTLRQRIQEMIRMAGLEGREDELTARLSVGWKQRLALGCAIVHHPQVVILDEPTAGVDPLSRRQFWELIYQMAKNGATVLVTTHYMEEAELCQKVGFISQGNLVALDTPEKLKQTQMRGYVLEIGSPEPNRGLQVLLAAQAHGRLPLEDVALYGSQIHVVVPSAEEYRQPIRQLLEQEGVPVSQIRWIVPTLEDVFISAVRR